MNMKRPVQTDFNWLKAPTNITKMEEFSDNDEVYEYLALILDKNEPEDIMKPENMNKPATKKRRLSEEALEKRR